tara:strand:+ start:270 stop:524 length:255 start_codon:yes stop_codon:yes gene_type:complete
MTTRKYIEKLAGKKNKDKIMAIDFDNNGFSIWLNEPYIFVINEAGHLGFDWNAFDSRTELKETLKDEWSMGITTREEYYKRFES